MGIGSARIGKGRNGRGLSFFGVIWLLSDVYPRDVGRQMARRLAQGPWRSGFYGRRSMGEGGGASCPVLMGPRGPFRRPAGHWNV